jgi:hypothetical protein
MDKRTRKMMLMAALMTFAYLSMTDDGSPLSDLIQKTHVKNSTVRNSGCGAVERRPQTRPKRK